MKLDHTLLSAYLDGELDESTRIRVEQALLDSPPLAAQLQELAAVRSLMGHLPRQVSQVDLTDSILARAEAHPVTRWRRLQDRVPGGRRLGTISAAFASAAALLLALYLGRGPAPEEQPAVQAPVSGLADTGAPSGAGAEAVPIEGGAASRDGRSEALANVAKQSSATPAVASETSDAAGDRLLLAGMLDEPQIRRTIIVLDELKPGLLAVVEGAILQTTRVDPRMAEVRVGQHLVLDPAWPNEAVVYAVRMQPDEYEQFASTVKAGLSDCEVQPELAPPGVVTQLAELDVSRVHPGRGVSLLAFDPPADLAVELRRPFTRGHVGELDGPDLIDRWTTSPADVAVREERDVAGDPSTRDVARPTVDDEPPVHLVWVTTRAPSTSTAR